MKIPSDNLKEEAMTCNELEKTARKAAQTEEIKVYELEGRAWKLFCDSFPKAAVFYEAMLQTTAESTGLNVPKIRAVEEIDGQYCIVSDFIKGKTVAELIVENPGKTDEYTELLVNTQLEIHSRIVHDVKKLKHQLDKKIKAAPFIDEIKKYELLTRLASMPEHNKLCHGNFTPENVVVDERGRVYILDWVAATRGNAGADAAGTYLRLTLQSTETAEKYLKLFCEKTGTRISYVQEWLPIAAAAYLTERNLTAKEKTVMLTWLDVVDYE